LSRRDHADFHRARTLLQAIYYRFTYRYYRASWNPFAINGVRTQRTPNMRQRTPDMRRTLRWIHRSCVSRYTAYAWKTSGIHTAILQGEGSFCWQAADCRFSQSHFAFLEGHPEKGRTAVTRFAHGWNSFSWFLAKIVHLCATSGLDSLSALAAVLNKCSAAPSTKQSFQCDGAFARLWLNLTFGLQVFRTVTAHSRLSLIPVVVHF
jgi:hypothetical protein